MTQPPFDLIVYGADEVGTHAAREEGVTGGTVLVLDPGERRPLDLPHWISFIGQVIVEKIEKVMDAAEEDSSGLVRVILVDGRHFDGRRYENWLLAPSLEACHDAILDAYVEAEIGEDVATLAAEAADIRNEISRILVRRMAEGAHPSTIAAGVAMSLSEVGELGSVGRMIAETIVDALSSPDPK